MTEREILKLRVAGGSILDAPILEESARGANWLAVIDVDPTMPGGLSRNFADKGRGECLYRVEKIALFDPIEFGADYTTVTGNKHRLRWHGVVIAKTEDHLIVEKAASGAVACLRAKYARTSPADRLHALELEREALIERAAKLETEITELRTAPPADGLDEIQRARVKIALERALQVVEQPPWGKAQLMFNTAEHFVSTGLHAEAWTALRDLVGKKEQKSEFWLSMAEARATLQNESEIEHQLRTELLKLMERTEVPSGRAARFFRAAIEGVGVGEYLAAHEALAAIHKLKGQSPEWLEAFERVVTLLRANDVARTG